MTENVRLTIAAPPAEDHAGAAYTQVAENRAAAEALEWLRKADDSAPAAAAPAASGNSGSLDVETLMNGGDAGTPAAAASGVDAPASGAPAAAGAAGAAAASSGDGNGELMGYAPDPGLTSKVIDWAKRAGADVGGGTVEAPRQAVGGVMDALGEMDQFMQQVLPIGGVQIWDDSGAFNPAFISSDQMMANNKAGEDLFTMLAPAEADTATGGFVRSTAQFLTGFIPGLQATKGMTALKGGAILSNMAAGALADMVVFDPNEDRLSTFLNQVPVLGSLVPDYLADNNPDQSHWEGRLKNAIEGAGLGLAADGLIGAFKYYKAARTAKAADRAAADPLGAQVAAAKDELKQSARQELVQDIPDEALRPLGDTAPEAPMLVEAPANQTAADAFTRISEARTRAAKSDKDGAALDQVKSIIELRGKKTAEQKLSAIRGRRNDLRVGMVRNGEVVVGKPGWTHADLFDMLDEGERDTFKISDMGFSDAKTGNFISEKDARAQISKFEIDENQLIKSAGKAEKKAGGELEVRRGGLSSEELNQYNRDADAATKSIVRDPLDEMLDELRSGAVSNAAIPRRPISTIVKDLGGIDPTSSFAGDLRSRGITSKSFPGLFRKGGLKNLDNIPAAEHPIFAGRTSDAAGYIDEQAFVDGLESELKGEPWMTPESQAKFDDLISPLDDLEQHLDGLGINYNEMSNESVRLRMQEIADADAIYKRDLGLDQSSTGRTLADVEKEARAEAEAKGLDPDLAAADATAPKVYLNHAKIQTADDVRGVLQQMLDLDADNIKTKTRGVVTNEQTIRESSQEYRELNDLIGRPPGPMTAAQATAARRLLASSGEQIVQLAKIAQAPSATAADLYNFRRAMAVHYALQSEVVAARTETARALQAWSIPAGATKARSQAIADLIASGGGAGDLQSLAKAVSNVGDNPTAVNTMARELGRGRFGKALYQVWINGLLSSPKTHAVNILSNAMTSLYAIPERYMSAGISKVFYDGEIAAGEASAQAYGLIKGIRDGVRLVYAGNRAEGAEGLGDVFDAFVKTDGVQQNAFSADALGMDPAGSFGYGIDMLGKIVNAPGSALNAEDKFFKTIGYRMELQALAYRQAMQEGLEGKEAAERVTDILLNPPDSLKADALDMAHYQTFTNPLSPGARQALGGIQKTPLIGPLFRLVVPFVKTPTNIMKYTFSRTPLAYASATIRADIAAGGARAAQAHARVALGSMIMLTIMDMAAEGSITGAGKLGPSESDTQGIRRTNQGIGGKPAYSIKIGDRWYAYNRLDPIAMVIGLGADMSEIFASADEADAENVATAGVVALAGNLASKTYLSGVFDFVAAIDPNNPTSNPGKYLSDFTTGLVPYSSFMRNMQSAYDPIARDAKTVVYGEEDGKEIKIDPAATYLDSMVNKIRKGIPGLSDDLPPMRDLYGEPIDRSSGIGWAYDFISPVASRADKPDPVTKVIVDNKVQISFPPRNIEGIQLSNTEYDEFSEIAGKMAKEQLDQLVSNPGFDKLSIGPDGMKAEMIRDVINQSRDYARAVMMKKNPELRDRAIGIQQQNMRSLTGN